MLVEQKQPNMGRRGLVVGNYCHDVLIRNDVVVGETLGGAASFISNVLDGVSIRCDLVSKVGSDFAYSVAHPPIVVPTSPTTLFHAFLIRVATARGPATGFSSASVFVVRLNRRICRSRGLISGWPLASPERYCRRLWSGCLIYVRSGFFHLLPRIGFLKASAEEAPYVDVEEARKWCCVLITNGKEGCTLYWKDGEMQISPFPTVQIDPTGAGDSFLGGFVAGLVQGLAVPDAALLGTFSGP
ncbi:Inositol 3-kinase [Vitis vinifera]|uniref:Inositol 3-kinase n=1 Tax=Vitis vinifera TaxID=29760 RepID=A0A438F9D9_VITVI|nr:Inositol 3-kinase [Vitis vinifera]